MFDTTKAACKDMPTDMFFPPSGMTKQAARAKAVCGTCEVRVQCLQWALTNKEFGIWGGTTYEERRSMSKKKKSLILNIKPK